MICLIKYCTLSLSHTHMYTHKAPRITSVTIDQSRFLSETEMRVMTCDFQPSEATVAWRLGSAILFDNEDMQITSPSQGRSTLTTSGADPGEYVCVVSNSVGAVVSEAIVLVVTEGGGQDMPGTHTHTHTHTHTIHTLCTRSVCIIKSFVSMHTQTCTCSHTHTHTHNSTNYHIH